MHNSRLVSSNSYSEDNLVSSALVAGKDFYEQVRSASSTMISLRYNDKELLIFKVYQASQGEIVALTNNDIGLCFRISNKIYVFNSEHLKQLSNSELNELFNQLGINGRQFLS